MITRDRLGTGLARVVLVLLLAGPLLNVHNVLRSLPRAAQLLGGAVIAVYLVFKMIRFPRWNDELQHFGKFLRAVITLLAVIVVENFLTWSVLGASAGAEKSHPRMRLVRSLKASSTRQPPLGRRRRRRSDGPPALTTGVLF